MRFGMKIAEIMPKLLRDCRRKEAPPEADGQVVFRNMSFDDMWDDAELKSCIVYLRGSRNLRIPEGWREILPTSI